MFFSHKILKQRKKYFRTIFKSPMSNMLAKNLHVTHNDLWFEIKNLIFHKNILLTLQKSEILLKENFTKG